MDRAGASAGRPILAAAARQFGGGGHLLPLGRRFESQRRSHLPNAAGSPWLVLVGEPDQLGVERTHQSLAHGLWLVELAE